MVTAELLDYVKKSLEQGADKETIRKSLVEVGWENTDVEEAFSKSSPQDETPTSQPTYTGSTQEPTNNAAAVTSESQSSTTGTSQINNDISATQPVNMDNATQNIAAATQAPPLDNLFSSTMPENVKVEDSNTSVNAIQSDNSNMGGTIASEVSPLDSSANSNTVGISNTITNTQNEVSQPQSANPYGLDSTAVNTNQENTNTNLDNSLNMGTNMLNPTETTNSTTENPNPVDPSPFGSTVTNPNPETLPTYDMGNNTYNNPEATESPNQPAFNQPLEQAANTQPNMQQSPFMQTDQQPGANATNPEPTTQQPEMPAGKKSKLGIIIAIVLGLAFVLILGTFAYGFVLKKGPFAVLFAQSTETPSPTSVPQPTTVPTTEPSPTPISNLDDKYYISIANQFKIKPPKGWMVDESGKLGTLAIFANPNPDKENGTDFSANINIISSASQKLDLASYKTKALNDLKKGLTDFKEVETSDLTLGTTPAFIIEGTYMQTNTKFHMFQLITIKDEKTYVATGTSLESVWTKYEKMLDDSLKTFEPNI